MKPLIPESVPDDMSLKEVCERCVIDAESVIRLVEYGIVDPRGKGYANWRFSSHGYLRIRRALRLQRDLDLNASGVALAIDLLEQLNAAHQEIRLLRGRLGEE